MDEGELKPHASISMIVNIIQITQTVVQILDISESLDILDKLKTKIEKKKTFTIPRIIHYAFTFTPNKLKKHFVFVVVEEKFTDIVSKWYEFGEYVNIQYIYRTKCVGQTAISRFDK